MKTVSKIFLLLAVVTIFAACAFASCPDPDTDWMKCITEGKRCHCYDKRNKAVPNTVDKRTVMYYNDIAVNRNYQDLALIFDPNVVTIVPAFGVRFEGVVANIGYFYLGDPNTSDQYQILNSTILRMVQEDNQVVLFAHQYFQNLQDSHIFNVRLVTYYSLSEDNQQVLIEIYPDSLAIQSNLPGATSLNTTAVCQAIFNDCTGANLAATQYTSVADCITFLNGLPVGSPNQLQFGYTLTCRSFHERLARSDPNTHCMHTGKQNINILVTPCNNYF